ncbi:DUF262 domain-containing protein [Pseudomonas juntendi]|uniref:DUF262 domain-containing protein n=1 Tax=Pseudomonas juntendi TaxID=2666183 RepID=UPI00320A5E6E
MQSKNASQPRYPEIRSAFQIAMPINVMHTTVHLHDIDHLSRNHQSYSASELVYQADYPWASSFAMGHPIVVWQSRPDWSDEQKKRFITDAWRGGYLGTYIVNSWHKVVEGSYESYSHLLIDGQKRLTALEHYFQDRFAVKDSSGNLRYWSELPNSERRRFLAIPFIKVTMHAPDEETLWALRRE